MTQVVLFHSALGLRPQVRRWAERLEAEGHTVVTPDLFDGEVFDNLEDGVKKRDAVGIEELSRRAQEAVADLPLDVVYAGFSMGAASAQALALFRPGARGAFLMHAALPPAAFGAPGWPAAVPAEVHAAQADPWVDWSVVEGLKGSGVAVTSYEGGAHLFADDDSAEFDHVAAENMYAALSRFVAARAA